MACPICEKRKAKRFCPAKGATICSVCCGTEREVSIDCPSDCPHLMASRKYDLDRREFDQRKLPFADVTIAPAFVAEHEKLVLALAYAVCSYARSNPVTVDADVQAALQSLAETHRTLSSGLYYENPPAYRVQRELYDALKKALEDFKKSSAQQIAASGIRAEEIRDVLIFLTQLAATRANGRPRGRAYLDFLRSQFKAEEFSKPTSNLIVLP